FGFCGCLRGATVGEGPPERRQHIEQSFPNTGRPERAIKGCKGNAQRCTRSWPTNPEQSSDGVGLLLCQPLERERRAVERQAIRLEPAPGRCPEGLVRIAVE